MLKCISDLVRRKKILKNPVLLMLINNNNSLWLQNVCMCIAQEGLAIMVTEPIFGI